MTGSRPPQGTAGFTLLELLVCLAVMAVIAGLAVPSWLCWVRNAALKENAGQLAEALRRTRAAAIASGRSAVVAVDTAAGDYRAGTEPIRTLPHDIRLSIPDDEDPQAAVWFYPDGSSSGGELRLSRSGQPASNRTIDVAVDWLTGAVSLRSGEATP